MSLDALMLPLLDAELFATLSPAQLKTVALCAERRSRSKGDVIIRAGEDSDAAILLMNGSLQAWPEEIGVGVATQVTPGTLLSEMAMFTETRHTYTVVAASNVHLLYFFRDDIEALLEREPALAESLMSGFSLQLEGLVEALRAADAQLEAAINGDARGSAETKAA